jgi:hypothetical protein
MAGAEPDEFGTALAEQLVTVVKGAAEIGCGGGAAAQAAGLFRAGAELEWQRIVHRSGNTRWGNA